MEIKMKIDRIDYGDAAVSVLGLLNQNAQHRDGAVSKLLSAMAQLPPELIVGLFDAIPTEQKNDIAASFMQEHKAHLLSLVNDLAQKNRIGLSVSDFSMNRHLEIVAEVDSIDYPCLVDKFLPLVKKNLLARGGMVTLLRPMIEKASADQICDLLDRFVGSNTDGFMATLINQNQNKLAELIEDTAAKQHIRLNISSVSAQV